MKRILAIFAFACLSFYAFAQDASVTAEQNGFKLGIKIQGKIAKISIEAPSKGWVAVGLDPAMGMKGADFLIGFVKDGVTVVRDDFGVSPMSHASDTSQGGIDNITAFSGEEKGGVTMITFSVPVDSGDAKDGHWTPGKHVIIMARSDSDNFNAIHSARTKFEITIPEAKK
jgi:hypothetical protein